PPTALHRRVVAVRGRGIPPLDGRAEGLDTRPQAREKWRPPPAACRALVHVALSPIARAVLRGAESPPPRCPRVDDASARLGGTAAGPRPRRRVFIDAPTRAIFFLAPPVLSTGVVSTTGVPPARERAKMDRGVTVQAHAFDRLRVLARVGCFCSGQKWQRWPCAFSAAGRCSRCARAS